ncbi:hypothetical protein M5E87_09795 [Flavonifractor plautii]|nr:hypothetical protein M5E87_09795 [Flavonifractor plautii]
MDHAVRDASADFIESLCAEYQKHNQIDPAFYERYRVKRACATPTAPASWPG